MRNRANIRVDETRKAVAHPLLHIAFAIGLFFAAALCSGCDANSTPISDTPAQASNGSFPTSNPADCLPAINLIDQHGKTVSLASLKGKPVLIDFIYANCATACPVLTSRFAKIAKGLGHNLGSKITMVSITLDPEHDHPAQLLEYAKTHDANHDGWLLLTGKPGDIDAVLSIYKIKREREPDGTISHVATSFLVGADGKQVRLYNAMEVAPETVVGDVDHALGNG
ncbi:MAG: SCO family protein [Deltaproteobacteria bacterium]|nr:SCO family protein [Deltaproteobacteria bacterium]